MSSAAVTPPMRWYGWNVHFLASSRTFPFAGIFQRDDFVTFDDVVKEMSLCFDLPEFQSRINADDSNPWADVGFAFLDHLHIPTEGVALPSCPNLVSHGDLKLPIPTPPATSRTASRQQPIARFQLVYHKHCSLPATAALERHLQDGCAQHILQPIRRADARYLPPKKPSPDPLFTRLPLRRTLRARGGSQSPSKRSSSGSVSPKKDMGPEDRAADGEDLASMVTPPDMDIAADFARQTIAGFRSSCLIFSSECAVTGKGQSWCNAPAAGPALQACHIVPQQHYHLYPDTQDLGNGDATTDYSPRRLREAWQRTWSPTNGILLLSHLHELFDTRLFSIHPDTLRIRAFVPYDVILDYHGHEARVPATVDRNALRHHYDMCCIENMAASMPLLEPLSVSSSTATPGTASPFNRARGPRIPELKSPGTHEQRTDENAAQSARGVPGDPSKRTVPVCEETDYWGEGANRSPSLTGEQGGKEGEVPNARKRRRIAKSTLQEDEDEEDVWGGDNDASDSDEGLSSQRLWEGHITPLNVAHFLGDVNWQLIREGAVLRR